MIKNIFFDFDGVIAESVNVKTDAFYKMYLKYGIEVAENVKKHHMANGGMSRFKKFVFYHKTFLDIELNQIEIDKLANEFSNLVIDGVINSDYVKGVENFIKKFYKKINFWIITGTPTNEINFIIERRNIKDYFKGAFGSPETKSYWVEQIMQAEKLNANESVFIGDATADYKAALDNNIRFILRQTEDNLSLFGDCQNICLIIKDFINFEKKIELL